MIYDYIALDVETTGLNPARDKILEIGAARVQNQKVCGTYETLIDTGVPIPVRIQELTGNAEDRKKDGNCHPGICGFLR